LPSITTLENRKLKTILDQANSRIHLSGCIANGERGKILPVLACEVFITSLNTLGIGHVTCDFEADNEIAALANDLKCPVISFDSDFYILSLTHGFIPFDSVNFDVQPTATDSDGQQYNFPRSPFAIHPDRCILILAPSRMVFNLRLSGS
jgi:hypothetical protein